MKRLLCGLFFSVAFLGMSQSSSAQDLDMSIFDYTSPLLSYDRLHTGMGGMEDKSWVIAEHIHNLWTISSSERFHFNNNFINGVEHLGSHIDGIVVGEWTEDVQEGYVFNPTSKVMFKLQGRLGFTIQGVFLGRGMTGFSPFFISPNHTGL